ncbi:MAG: sigma-70 family RNA polymerase sigma factor, partial [Clostridia bacterium]|nr:sigma-70 family RNA polymerase sigma factor [Clostridia bacterium]
IIDKIKGKDDYLKIDDKIILKNALKSLDERERKILILRYFRDKTQSEIAKYFGLSQVQISRIESKIIKKLKMQFEE